MKNYTIEVMDSGMVLKGSIGLTAFPHIQKMAESLGFDIIDPGLAQALSAVMVITNKEGSAILRAEVEESNKGKSREDAWISGCDTGTSSKTIFFTLTGRGTFDRPDVPYDPGDFGRCYRLLQIFPEWVGRLNEVAKRHSRWKRLVDNWKDLSGMYERDEGMALRDRIKELIS